MPKTAFSSKQLVQRALQGLEIPRVPAGPLAVHFCARFAGVTLQQYTHQARVLAECVIRYCERFGPDAVWVSADTWVSAEAMGAQVGASSEHQPTGGLGMPLVEGPRDIDRIPPPAPEKQGRYPLMLEAMTRIVQALGREVFVVACFDQYPFSLAAALMGLSQIMLKLKDDPPMVTALMERCLEYGAAYGRALGLAGADMLSGGDSPACLLGPSLYRGTALPLEKRLIAELKSAVPRPVSLHVCGKALPILGDMASSGADVIEIDQEVDLEQACRVVGPSIALWGNLDPVGLLAQGSTEQVRQTTQDTLGRIKTLQHDRFVLSSGCTLAVETPPQNLTAMLEAARSFALAAS